MRNDLPIDERHNNALNYEQYLSDPHFHHSQKGCEVKMELTKDIKHLGVIKKCLTHEVVCSKTGWELGWYGGTTSKQEIIRTQAVVSCHICHREFSTYAYNAKFCPECKQLKIVFRPVNMGV